MTVDAAKAIVFRQTGAGWASAAATGLVALLSLFMLAMASLFVISGEFGMGLFIAAVAGFMAVLFLYVLRDARGKLGLRIAISAEAIEVDLPPGRSLIHRLKALHARIPMTEIAAVETRLEAYRSLGLANMQRTNALRLKSGEIILLGEDRAQGTALATGYFTPIAATIAERAGVELHDLGMTEGKGGVLAIAFTAPPQWDAPTLAPGQQAALWKTVALTGWVAAVGSVIVALAAAFNLLF